MRDNRTPARHNASSQDWIERLLSLNESAIRPVVADDRRHLAAMH